MSLSRELRKLRKLGKLRELRKRNTICQTPWGIAIYRVFFSSQTPYIGVDTMHDSLTCHQ
ncbi:MAG: hypothetical protein F6J96_23770 [Symploca sp. SIO1C2]|nr:hypothetical protein [Symploca sp. SIO1C2]